MTGELILQIFLYTGNCLLASCIRHSAIIPDTRVSWLHVGFGEFDTKMAVTWLTKGTATEQE